MSTTDRVTAVIDRAASTNNTALAAVIARARALTDDEAATLHRHLAATSDAAGADSAKGHRLCSHRPIPGHGRTGSHRPDRRSRRRRMVRSRARSLRRSSEHRGRYRKMVTHGGVGNRPGLDANMGRCLAGAPPTLPVFRLPPPFLAGDADRTASLRSAQRPVASPRPTRRV